MIKKAGNIAIIILLLIATGGVPVTRHYCGLVQKSVSFYTTPKSCCGEGCDKCHNVLKFNKVNDDFEAGSSITVHTNTDIVTLHTAFFIDLFDNINTSSLSDPINQRAVDISEAGHSPAFLGSFRC